MDIKQALTNLFPEPQKIEIYQNFNSMKSWHWIADQHIHHLFMPCWDWLESIYPKFKSILSEKVESSAPLYLVVDKKMPEQAYQLWVDTNKITISASGEKGFYYGLHCLGQLSQIFKIALPCLKIDSCPILKNRGYLLDISRCKVPKLSEIKQLIDHLSIFHYNHLELYIEHTFAFDQHSLVWGDSSPLTHDDILELDLYCRHRFIDLVPNLNSFGHFERWLKHGEYQSLAECPEGFTSPFGDFRPVGSVLKPNQKSLQFIDELYTEYLPLFSHSHFNVGCDETFELGQGYSKKQVLKLGLHEVYLRHLLKIQKLVKKHGRKMMFWADILIEDPKSIEKLPKDITPLIWGYEADHPFEKQCRLLEKSETDYWVCPGSGSWNSLVGRWDNAKANIESAYLEGIAHKAKGLLLTDWGDGGHHQTWPISWPSLLFTAQLTWSGKSLSEKALANLLDYFFFRHHGVSFGEQLLIMGKLHTKLNSPIMNGNAYHHYLFNPNHKCKKLSKLKLTKHLKELEEINEELIDLKELCFRELSLSLTLAIQSIKKQLSLNHGVHSAKAERQYTIGLYEKIWIERNHIGGLFESSQKLRHALNY